MDAASMAGPLQNLTPECQTKAKRAAYVLVALPVVGAYVGYKVAGLLGAVAGFLIVPRVAAKPLIDFLVPMACQVEIKNEVARLRAGA